MMQAQQERKEVPTRQKCGESDAPRVEERKSAKERERAKEERSKTVVRQGAALAVEPQN